MRKPIAFLLGSSLVACHHEPGHEVTVPTAYVAPDFEANLKGKDLACCIVRDTFVPAAPLQAGKGKPEDPASWNDKDGALQMLLAGPGSMGVFRTGLNFGRGSIFSISATFRNPMVAGAVSDKPWTVVVAARTGDVDDADNLGRLQVSMQSLPVQPLSGNINRVELRVQEGPNIEQTKRIGEARKIIDGLVHDEIFGSPNPFTITLVVDRASGRGGAILTTKTQAVELEFEQALFSDDNGDPLTVAGAVLVNQGAGRSASVEVTHFEIWDNTP